MAKSEDIEVPGRPPRPEPYGTPDAVSLQMRRVGGYAWRLIAIGIVVYAAVLLLAPLETLLMALFFGLLVAAWLMPLTNFLARRWPRWLAGVTSLLLFIIAVVLVVAFIGIETAGEWEGIGRAFSQGVEDLNAWLRGGPLQITDANMTAAYESLASFLRESGSTIAFGIVSGLGSLVGLATALAASIFVLLFTLMQPKIMFGWFTGWLPARNREVVATSVRIAWMSFSQYSRGVLIIALTNAVLVTILLLILGVPLAIPLGVIVFFGAFIPYIGAPVAMFLAAFVALVTDGVLAGALVVILIFVIGQLEGNVLQPVIMGKSVNLHPVAIVLVTAVGAAYFGLLGALIGVPIAASVYGVMKYLQGVRADGATGAPESQAAHLD